MSWIEEKYKRLFEVVSDAIFLIDMDTLMIIDANRAASELYGYTRDEFLLRHNYDLSAEPEQTMAVVRGEISSVPIRYHRKKNGEVFPVEINGSYFEWEGRKLHLASIRDISMRLRGEAAIRESEEKYRLLADNMSDIIWTMDLHLRTTYVSPSVMKVLGFTPEERMRQGIEEQLTSASLDMVRNRIKSEMELEIKGTADPTRSITMDVEYYRRDGSTIWMEVVVSAIRGKDGQIECLLGVSRDITERRRVQGSLMKKSKDLELAERQGRDRLNFLYVVINSIQAPVFFKDTKGQYSGCNSAFEQLIDLPLSEIVGKTVFDLWPPDLAATFDHMDRELFMRGGMQTYEVKVRRPDGTYCDILNQNSLFSGTNDIVGGIVGVMVDITDSKRAEEAAREAQRFAQSTVNALDANIAILNDTGGIISVNRAWWEFARENGINPAYIFEGVNYLDVCDAVTGDKAEGAAGFAAGIRDVMKGAVDVYEQEYPCHSAEERRWFIGKVSRFYDEGPLRIVVAHSDITTRKLAEEKMAASLNEKEVLLREIHHRVKNNLQVISSIVGLQSRSVRYEGLREELQSLQNRIRSMAIIHDRLYRSENLAEIDFHDYVTELCGNIVRSYGAAPENIACSISVEGIRLKIQDAVPVGLIVNELVTNAMKHAFPGGRKGSVSIAMKRDDESGELILFIRDDGTGLPPGIDMNSNQTLGLRMVDILVKQLEGIIEVKRDEGTEFMIRFRD